MTNSSTSENWHVFLSFAGEERDKIVFPLVQRLRVRGLSVWYDVFRFQSKDRLNDKMIQKNIDEGIQMSDLGMIVMSSDYMKKKWPRYEFMKLQEDKAKSGRFIIVINKEENIDLVELPSSKGQVVYFTSSEDFEWITDIIYKTLEPRQFTKIYFYTGKTEITLIPELGSLGIENSNPTTSPTGFFDLNGKTDIDEEWERYAAQTAAPARMFPIEADKVAVVQMNRRLCSQNDVENSTIMILEIDDLKFPVVPLYSSDYYSLAVFTNDIGDELNSNIPGGWADASHGTLIDHGVPIISLSPDESQKLEVVVRKSTLQALMELDCGRDAVIVTDFLSHSTGKIDSSCCHLILRSPDVAAEIAKTFASRGWHEIERVKNWKYPVIITDQKEPQGVIELLEKAKGVMP